MSWCKVVVYIFVKNLADICLFQSTCSRNKPVELSSHLPLLGTWAVKTRLRPLGDTYWWQGLLHWLANLLCSWPWSGWTWTRRGTAATTCLLSQRLKMTGLWGRHTWGQLRRSWSSTVGRPAQGLEGYRGFSTVSTQLGGIWWMLK